MIGHPESQPVDSGAVALQDVLITDQLAARPPRAADHEAEGRALGALAQGMAERPEALLQQLVDTVMDLCQAGAAGVSIVERDGENEVFRWIATAGLLAPFARSTMPRCFSPCGEVLDADAPLLMSNPGRYYSGPADLGFDVCELLLIPFRRSGKAVGTVWAVSHTPERQFDAEDVRLLESLSRFASAAVQVLSIADESRRASAAANANEKQYHSLFNSIDQGFGVLHVIFDEHEQPIDYRFIDVNPVFTRQTGLVDPVGRTMREMAPNMESHWFEIYGRVALTGEPIRFVEKSDALGRVFDVYAFRHGAPDERKVAVLFSDVTARKQVESIVAEADRRKEQRLIHQRRLLDAVSAMRVNVALSVEAVLQTLSEVIREAIEAHQCVTSLTIGELWSHTVNALSVSDKYASAFDGYSTPPNGAGIYRLVVEQNRPFRMTQAELEAHPAWRGFGEERGKHPPMRGWLAAPMLGVDGRAIGLIQLSDKIDGEFTFDDELQLVQFSAVAAGLLENVRLYRQAESEVRSRQAAEAALQQADRRKDEFLAMLAHELRNPLAPLRNGLQVMRLAADDRETIAECRDMMDRQLSHMVRLIDDLLDVSRVSQNKMELRCERTAFADVIASAVETALPVIEAAGHEFHVALPPHPVYLNADLTRLAQVFSNLLTNSAKYTTKRGRIALTAELVGDELVVEVADDGIGIPASSLPLVFDLFAQVDRSVERASGGLGIGLSLVKGLVEMHGGSVSAASEGVGQGSTFTVRLPYLAQESSAAPVARSADAGPTKRRRVLVADDNRDAADSLTMTLRLLGHETATAYDGLEALEVGERFRPHIVLLDVGMPRLSGHDAARRIRTTDWGRPAVVVALTGWGQASDRDKSHAAGCDGHLVKPVSLPDLQATLQRLLGAD